LFQDRPGDVLAVLDQSGPLSRERAAAIDTERMILGAHALARLDRDDEALERIKSLQNAAAHHVRAEIFWKQQNWDRLSLAIEAFLRDPVLPSPLPEEDQKLVLWLALAQGQLRQTEELGELRRRFGADMASGPWGDAFAVATQTAGRRRDIPAVLADTESQIAEMQKFRESVRATP
jgi:hypothetical protein